MQKEQGKDQKEQDNISKKVMAEHIIVSHLAVQKRIATIAIIISFFILFGIVLSDAFVMGGTAVLAFYNIFELRKAMNESKRLAEKYQINMRGRR